MTSNPAGELVEALRLELPADPHPWDVEPYATDPGNLTPGVPVVRVFRRSIKPSPFLGRYTNTMELWLLDEHMDAIEADDSLSTRLDVLIEALDRLAIDWPDGAERGYFGEKIHAYKITFDILTER